MTPRIALSQAPYHREMDVCLARTLGHMRQARQLGADLIVFPEWFLGLNPLEVLPNRQTEILAQTARQLALGVVTGSLRTLDPETGQKQQRALIIDDEGRIVGSQGKCEFYAAERPWFESAEGIAPIVTRWGRMVLLLGLDAQSPARWAECRQIAPDIVIMATSPRNLRERETLHAEILDRSLEIGGTVVLVPLLGRFAGSHYPGGAAVAHRGRLLVDAGEGEKVVIASTVGSSLIQLGVVDASAWWPLTPVPPGFSPVETKDLRGPEPERRVFVDWGSLQASDPLAAGRQLLSQAADTPRTVALAPAHPHHPRVLEVLLSEGARGAFAWPGLACVPAFDALYRAVAEVLARDGRPLLIQVGPGSTSLRYAQPEDWDDVALGYPEVPLILLSSGVRAPYLEKSLSMAAVRPNVYLETSRAPVDFLRDAVQELGPDRLLFGTGGLPAQFGPEWSKMAGLQDKAGLDDDAFARVVGLNARRLFFGDPGRPAVSLDAVEPISR